MIAENIAIKVDHLYKGFRLPHEKNSSIKGAVVNFYKRNKSYEVQQVLKDISFEVKKGEFLGIVGRNGSGKSTLLKLLAGIYTPDRGSVVVEGKLTPFIELGVGFNPELTGRENVFLNGALLGFNRKETSAMYDEIVEFAEIERFMDQKLKNYSSGMQVRLAFSIAIRAESEILVLDEVLAVGDAAFQRKCYNYFMSLKKNKRTVILVTHDMGAVRQYCDRAIMIELGEVVEQGRPEKVAQAYQKLFSDDADEAPRPITEEDRWGSGEILAKPPVVSVTKANVVIETVYVASKAVPAPIYGISIYNGAGDLIADSNTKRLKVDTKNLVVNQEVRIVWEVPNVFVDGKHSLSVACCDKSATNFYDWLNGSEFIIRKDEPSSALVDPGAIISSYDTKEGE